MLNTTLSIQETKPLGSNGTETNTKDNTEGARAVPFQAVMAKMQASPKGQASEGESAEGTTGNAEGVNPEDAGRQEIAAGAVGPEGLALGTLMLGTVTVGASTASATGAGPSVSLTGTAGALSAAELKLKQLPLGQQMTLITSDQPSPNDASLSEFAQQQGLDAQTIRWLLTSQPRSLAGVQGVPGATAANEAMSPTLGLSTGLVSNMLAPTAMGANVVPVSGSVMAGPAVSPVLGDGSVVTLGLMNGKGLSNPGARVASSELDLTQDGSVDWSAWIKTLTPIRQEAAALGPNAGPIEGVALTDNGALALGLDSASQDGLGQDGALPQAPPAQAAPNGFKSELGKAQGTDAFLARGMTTTGQDLADQMSQAIGKRLLESIEKGEWQLKINLKPAELGHIEVDLRMKDHALEARFSAQQGLTRDLIEGGLGRLKETLQHSGMDVASLKVNDGPSSRNGGDSTPRHAPSGGQVLKSTPEGSTETEVMALPRTRSNAPGGLDLMV